MAIIGLSGAGKSTLIRTINRMIDVTEGQLIVDGVDVMSLKGKAMRRYRRKIGMIFRSYNLVTRSTAIKNVLSSMVPDMPFLRVFLGLFTKEQKMKALEALDKVDILDKAYTRCDELSGGQQQRVSLARTLNQDTTIILAAVLWGCLELTGCNFSIIVSRGYQLTVILGKMFQPDFEYFPKVVTPLIETIQMSLIGSAIGATLALPFSVAASTNIVPNKAVVSVLRFILSIVRTLPTLIIAELAALVFGLGTFAGTVAIVLFTFGVVSKMMYEAIETIDMGAYEAMQAAGCTSFQKIRYGMLPQIIPNFISTVIYRFDINMKDATTLGIVGAGGIGAALIQCINSSRWSMVGSYMFGLIILMLNIEVFSTKVRTSLSQGRR